VYGNILLAVWEEFVDQKKTAESVAPSVQQKEKALSVQQTPPPSGAGAGASSSPKSVPRPPSPPPCPRPPSPPPATKTPAIHRMINSYEPKTKSSNVDLFLKIPKNKPKRAPTSGKEPPNVQVLKKAPDKKFYPAPLFKNKMRST
jgi:hypothetical protein